MSSRTRRGFTVASTTAVFRSVEEQSQQSWDKPSFKIWDLNTLAKIREQELHDKGVKCIDINNKVILTGSYDATLKVRYWE